MTNIAFNQNVYTVLYWYDAFQAREAAPVDGTTAEGVGGTEQRGPKRAISAISAGGGW